MTRWKWDSCPSAYNCCFPRLRVKGGPDLRMQANRVTAPSPRLCQVSHTLAHRLHGVARGGVGKGGGLFKF